MTRIQRIAIGGAALVLLVAIAQHAFADWTGTRESAYDWACIDTDGTTIISSHQREGTAQQACSNLVQKDGKTRYVQGGRYRITSATTPAPTPPLSAPTVTAVIQPGTNPGRYNVVLTWPAVTRATAYEVERCEGAACTSFTALSSVTVLEYRNSNLPSGFTFRYRVRPAEGQQLGPWSAIVTAQTPATGVASATVSWIPPTQNTDNSPLTDLQGYRLVWGSSPTALSNAVSIDNESLTSYVVTGLSAGTWYFALYARSAAGESAQSNIASKVLP
jgi:hypothetical protein